MRESNDPVVLKLSAGEGHYGVVGIKSEQGGEMAYTVIVVNPDGMAHGDLNSVESVTITESDEEGLTYERLQAKARKAGAYITQQEYQYILDRLF